jgi:hypothetical protein
MAGSGSDTRQREITLKARFSQAEAALIREQADRAGLSVAAVIRHAVLAEKPLRAARRPSVNHELAAQLLGTLGLLAASLREAELAGQNVMAIEAAQRDLAELRTLLFEAMGRAP